MQSIAGPGPIGNAPRGGSILQLHPSPDRPPPPLDPARGIALADRAQSTGLDGPEGHARAGRGHLRHDPGGDVRDQLGDAVAPARPRLPGRSRATLPIGPAGPTCWPRPGPRGDRGGSSGRGPPGARTGPGPRSRGRPIGGDDGPGPRPRPRPGRRWAGGPPCRPARPATPSNAPRAVTTSRVVPEVGSTIDRSYPASALSSRLLPTLGRPARTTRHPSTSRVPIRARSIRRSSRARPEAESSSSTRRSSSSSAPST